MKNQTGLTLAFAITCLFLTAFPAFAGEWEQVEEDQWQYIQDDGTKAVGWLEIDEKSYYFDEEGNRKSDCWKTRNGYWYHLGEDGVVETNTWVDNYYVDKKGRFTKMR